MARTWRLHWTNSLHFPGMRWRALFQVWVVWQREQWGITVVREFPYESFNSFSYLLLSVLLLYVFLSNCCSQQMVLSSTHDLYILCLQFTIPPQGRGEGRRERVRITWFQGSQWEILNWGVPFLTHTILLYIFLDYSRYKDTISETQEIQHWEGTWEPSQCSIPSVPPPLSSNKKNGLQHQSWLLRKLELIIWFPLHICSARLGNSP